MIVDSIVLFFILSVLYDNGGLVLFDFPSHITVTSYGQTPKLHMTDALWGKSMTGTLPSQPVSYSESVSM